MELLKIFFFLKVAWISFQEFQTDMEYLFCGKILRDKNFLSLLFHDDFFKR